MNSQKILIGAVIVMLGVIPVMTVTSSAQLTGPIVIYWQYNGGSANINLSVCGNSSIAIVGDLSKGALTLAKNRDGPVTVELTGPMPAPQTKNATFDERLNFVATFPFTSNGGSRKAGEYSMEARVTLENTTYYSNILSMTYMKTCPTTTTTITTLSTSTGMTIYTSGTTTFTNFTTTTITSTITSTVT